MLKVGSKGDVGDVELQDLLFTNIGATAGLIHVEWNIRAKSPGSAALWGMCYYTQVIYSQKLTGNQIVTFEWVVPWEQDSHQMSVPQARLAPTLDVVLVV